MESISLFDLVLFYRFLILGLVIVAIFVVWFAYRRRWWCLSVLLVVVFAGSAIYVRKTIQLASFNASLETEADDDAQISFYRLKDSLTQTEILYGICNPECDENTRFYLCLALKDKLRNKTSIPQSVREKLARAPLIKPGFFNTNSLNVPYIYQIREGKRLTALELVNPP